MLYPFKSVICMMCWRDYTSCYIAHQKSTIVFLLSLICVCLIYVLSPFPIFVFQFMHPIDKKKNKSDIERGLLQIPMTNLLDCYKMNV